MKLKEAIELYRSKEKSTYPAENWVRLGSYLEPHLDEIELLTTQRYGIIDSKEDLIKELIKEAESFLKEKSPENSTYAVGKRDMFKKLLTVMGRYM